MLLQIATYPDQMFCSHFGVPVYLGSICNGSIAGFRNKVLFNNRGLVVDIFFWLVLFVVLIAFVSWKRKHKRL